jgi:putative iron-dependent peroxidase
VTHGTVFVGFSRDQAILRAMLYCMLWLGDGPADELMGVARALTGAYYVIPSADRLAQAGGAAAR